MNVTELAIALDDILDLTFPSVRNYNVRFEGGTGTAYDIEANHDAKEVVIYTASH